MNQFDKKTDTAPNRACYLPPHPFTAPRGMAARRDHREGEKAPMPDKRDRGEARHAGVLQ